MSPTYVSAYPGKYYCSFLILVSNLLIYKLKKKGDNELHISLPPVIHKYCTQSGNFFFFIHSLIGDMFSIILSWVTHFSQYKCLRYSKDCGMITAGNRAQKQRKTKSHSLAKTSC